MSDDNEIRITRNPPLTIAGRSPFNGIRLRWGGLGAVILGIALMFSMHNGGAIAFSVLLILLGIVTWVTTSFGRVYWYDIPMGFRVVAGAGSVIGLAFI